ncbi:DUF3152 domain-containing protein [Streptomyces radiopugnans]|uniref:DUF3152 domain-containing protein n=1 Tax=Streptomyces radiopugnans TaxID=403935 RepID=UPI003F1C9511
MGRHSRRGRPGSGKPTATADGQRPAARPAPEEAPHPRPAPQHLQPEGRVAGPHGAPRVRGGHPEQREPGGGWGLPPRRPPAPGAGRGHGPAGPPRETVYGTGRMPRREYVEAFDDGVYGSPGVPRADGSGPEPGAGARGRADGLRADEPDGEAGRDGEGGGGRDGRGAQGARGGRGRAFTGVAAAAVTTVLAVVVAGQVADGRSGMDRQLRAGGDAPRAGASDASRSEARPTPSDGADEGKARSGTRASYGERMGRLFDLAPDFEGSGRLTAVAGRDEAPGKGEVVRYRVDVEDGLPLDGELFAEAVHRTLNDERSWSHGGARTFERVSGKPGESGGVAPVFVITLASPSTTAKWCARSGLDTTVDNVSCDSASTERVMINAYRWARGADTFGPDRIREYREMLINHEVGHRLGKGHVNCPKEGALAPVMMQQTKYLTVGGATCRPNAWPFPDA